MPSTSSPRRALGLLAAGTIGLSTALLGVAGVAHAEPGAPVAAEAEVAAALAVPNPPVDLELYKRGNTFVVISFLKGASDPLVHAPYTGFEASTDDGATWQQLYAYTQGINTDRLTIRIPNLVNERSYTVRLRTTSAQGPSAASDAITAAPQTPIPVPTNVVATAVPGKLTVTWEPPVLPPGRDVVAYQADIMAVLERPNAGNICQTLLAERTCVATDVLPGEEFEVQVAGFDEYWQVGAVSEIIRVTVPYPVPATVPASNGALTPDAGSSDKVVAGKSMVVKGTGYRPGSTVKILMYSEPQELTSVVADGSGNFTVTVTVPAGLAPGQHTLVASGVDGSGNARYMNLPVTVSASGVATVASRRLAVTGADVTVPAIAGIAALAVGAGLIGASRRRSAA